MSKQITAMQKLIDYMEENYHLTEESRYEFKKALEEEKKQLISFAYKQIQEMESELGDMIYKKVPEEIYAETFNRVD